MDWPAPEAGDEGRHEPGSERWWGESWYFDFARADGDLGGYVRIGLYPNQGVAWYWGCLVGTDRPLVTVLEHGAPPPPGSRSLEVRSSGLWADHHCEEPLARWSLASEAFGLAVDDPRELYADEPRGDRVPFGFELEWESVADPFRYTVTDRYEIPCRVQGEVLVGDETIELDAVGQRDHSWGVRDWWQFGWVWSAFHASDGTQFFGNEVTLDPDHIFRTGYVQGGSTPARVLDDFTPTFTPQPDGLVDGISWASGGVRADLDLLGWAPVLLVDGDRRSHFARGMARAQLDDGRSAVGWIEFNQPTA
jgi:hypothetical protein